MSHNDLNYVHRILPAALLLVTSSVACSSSAPNDSGETESLTSAGETDGTTTDPSGSSTTGDDSASEPGSSSDNGTTDPTGGSTTTGSDSDTAGSDSDTAGDAIPGYGGAPYNDGILFTQPNSTVNDNLASFHSAGTDIATGKGVVSFADGHVSMRSYDEPEVGTYRGTTYTATARLIIDGVPIDE